MDKKFQDIYPEKPYIIPRCLNQNIVESWFSHQRGLCGDSREPTVSQYGQNNTKLLSLKKSKGGIFQKIVMAQPVLMKLLKTDSPFSKIKTEDISHGLLIYNL
jgi:hypothetical protein